MDYLTNVMASFISVLVSEILFFLLVLLGTNYLKCVSELHPYSL